MLNYLHTMVRVRDLDASLHFYCELLGLQEIRRKEVPQGRFTLVFLATAEGEPELELTHNWDQGDDYPEGRNFGHLAYNVDNIYELCERFQAGGVEVLRPPRDGRMAFVKSPDGISIELLQSGEALAPAEPWLSMGNTGSW